MKKHFSAVDMFVSAYFAVWLLSLNKPPISAIVGDGW
jgi:hypothetical protein